MISVDYDDIHWRVRNMGIGRSAVECQTDEVGSRDDLLRVRDFGIRRQREIQSHSMVLQRRGR